MFTPRHPATHPKREKILQGEEKLDGDALVAAAVENAEVVDL